MDDAVVVSTAGQQEERLPADTVIIADLVSTRLDLKGSNGAAVYTIGDSLQVRRGFGAVRDGYRMGMKISQFPYKLLHRK